MAEQSSDQPIIYIPPWLWLVLSALLSLLITAGTGFVAAASALSPGTTLPTFSIIVILVGGVMQGAKDVKTFIAPSPTLRVVLVLCTLLVPSVVLWGCAGTAPRSAYTQHKLLVQASVQLGILSALRQHPGWATPLARAVEGARGALTTDEVDLATIVPCVTTRLHFQMLTPEEQVFVSLLAQAIQAELTALVADQRIAQDVRVVAREVFDWIAAVAVVYEAREHQSLTLLPLSRDTRYG